MAAGIHISHGIRIVTFIKRPDHTGQDIPLLNRIKHIYPGSRIKPLASMAELLKMIGPFKDEADQEAFTNSAGFASSYFTIEATGALYKANERRRIRAVAHRRGTKVTPVFWCDNC